MKYILRDTVKTKTDEHGTEYLIVERGYFKVANLYKLKPNETFVKKGRRPKFYNNGQ